MTARMAFCLALAALAPAVRAAEWISPAKECPRACDTAAFVKTFVNSGEVARAVWRVTGLGVFEAYVNGREASDDRLKPGYTEPAKCKHAYTCDVTGLVDRRPGATNVLAALVTSGWWRGGVLKYGKESAFRGELALTYSDGSREVVGTDTSWRAAKAGPVRRAGIYYGEDYDAREDASWMEHGRVDWPAAVPNREFAGEIRDLQGPPVRLRRDLEMRPVSISVLRGAVGVSRTTHGRAVVLRRMEPGAAVRLEPGETLVADFGQNAAAVPGFSVEGAAGTRLAVRTAEMLNEGVGEKGRGNDGPAGTLYRANLRGIRAGVDYFLRDGAQAYETRFSYFGYRYLSFACDRPVVLTDIRSTPMSSISAEMECGTIETGNEAVNRLVSNVRWGMLSNYLSIPTDCPQRDERLGWTADTQVFTETGTFFANTSGFFHKWMRDMMDSQSELGGFPGVAPTSQYGGEMMRLGWADAGIIVPWTIWKQFGDKEIVNESWASMERFMTWVNDTKYSHEAHLAENGNYQWADWLSYEPLESCSGRSHGHDKDGHWNPLPETIDYWNYLSASYWALDASMMRDMAAATGRNAKKYADMVDEAKAYIRDTFLNPDGTFKTDILNTMQTPALFALKNGVVEGEAKAAMTARLRENFAQHDGCLQTGFLGTSILMGTLTDNGMADIAWDLLFQHKNPSWLYSVDNGATTIWERWNSYTIENGMGPAGMNSFNHYAYGSVCAWIWETVAGIAADTATPGFKHIIMRPVPDKRLGFVKAEYQSAAGPIKSEWKYEGDKWLWTFTIPEGTTASVTLPGETTAKEYQPGTYSVEK